MATAHCGTCHNTFTGVTAFDRHRRGGTCLDPSSVGMIDKRSYGCWGFDEDRPERSYPPTRDETWREDRWI